jgi:peptide/nickel transport system ATP-binding protein
VTTQAQILRLLKEIKNELGTSILLITHDLGVIAEMCDRVGAMYAGALAEEAAVDEIFENPKHPYTGGLWGAIPRVDEEKEALAVIPGTVPDLSDPPAGCRFDPRCRRRFEPCDRTIPSLFSVSAGRRVSCHLYL